MRLETDMLNLLGYMAQEVKNNLTRLNDENADLMKKEPSTEVLTKMAANMGYSQACLDIIRIMEMPTSRIMESVKRELING